jgi:putative PIN family toxin of toxin-antitoxin system
VNIVLDTNVIVSSICFPFSKPRKVFDISRNQGKILISKETFNELKNVLIRNKFDTFMDISSRLEFLNKYQSIGKEIFITTAIQECRDEKDNKFLELAVNGNAEYLITGDLDLLCLNPFRSIKIVTPNTFILDFI